MFGMFADRTSLGPRHGARPVACSLTKLYRLSNGACRSPPRSVRPARCGAHRTYYPVRGRWTRGTFADDGHVERGYLAARERGSGRPKFVLAAELAAAGRNAKGGQNPQAILTEMKGDRTLVMRVRAAMEGLGPRGL